MTGDPLGFSIPFVGLVLHTDALLALAGVAVGMAAFRVAARERDLPPPPFALLLDVVLWSLLAGRLWYVAEQWPFYVRYPVSVFNVLDGGIAAPGLVVGAAAALWGMRYVLGRPSELVVLLAPALAAGRAVQSVGCVLTGCLVGQPTTLPWAAEQSGALRHPAALYVVFAFVAAWLVAHAAARKERPAWLGPSAYAAAELVSFLTTLLLSASPLPGS